MGEAGKNLRALDRLFGSVQTECALEDGGEAEIAEGIFKVGIEPLDRPHRPDW